MGEKCEVPQADRAACEEAVLKDAANSFALKKERNSRFFTVLCFLFCAAQVCKEYCQENTDNLQKK